MKLALLICAKPVAPIQAAKVYVPTGLWKVVTEKVLDTDFTITTSPSVEFRDCTSLTKDKLIQGPCFALVWIETPGTEKYINIYLEQIRGEVNVS